MARARGPRPEMFSHDWESITKQHPELAEHEDAVNYLAHAHDGDSEAEGHSAHELSFTHEHVDPAMIRYNKDPMNPRTYRAREGYSKNNRNPPEMPPLLLVKRGQKYDVADGHHRAEAAHGLNKGDFGPGKISAVVTNRAVRKKLPSQDY